MSIQWGRILLAAFLMELILFAIAIPLFLGGLARTLVYVVPPVALISTFAVTLWLGKGMKANFVLQGVLIGIVGTLMYVALTRAQPEPWQYWLAHALKVVGGGAAGMVLANRRTAGNNVPSTA
jgi:membrane-associated HD superfamily phosphohydrolase